MGKLISDCERDYLAAQVEDHIQMSGVNVEFYSAVLTSDGVDPNLDPLYDEPRTDEETGNEKWKFVGPYSVVAIVKKGSRSVSGEERGQKIEYSDAEAFFARITFDRESLPYPKEGDVVVWEDRPFDVLVVHHEGLLGDTMTFTKFKCEMKQTTIFRPSLRIDDGDVNVTSV